MVWHKHPESGDPLTSTWEEFPLFDGPDAGFCYYEIPLQNGLTRYVIFSTQYFLEKLVMSWYDGELQNLNYSYAMVILMVFYPSIIYSWPSCSRSTPPFSQPRRYTPCIELILLRPNVLAWEKCQQAKQEDTFFKYMLANEIWLLCLAYCRS